MTILQLQRRIAEVGRIRIGQQVKSGKGTRPTKLTTFRLTSANKTRVDQAAYLYGGNVTEWEAPAGQQWEVVTEADALPVIVPPSDMAFSQHYELWSAGGCQRRCDGNYESITDQPCICNPEARECSIHTRLSVMLRDLPGLGVWRVDTSGYYAAVELQGAVEVIQIAAGKGQMLPAQLRLEQRMVKRGGKTMRFAVPMLDVEISPAQLVGGHTQVPSLDGQRGTVSIEPPPQKAIDSSSPLTPVPESVPQEPSRSIQAQVETQKPSRRRSQSVPSTGIKPRTAAQAKASERPARNDEPPPPDEPPPDVVDADVQAAPGSDPPATPQQNRKMHAIFREVGLTERDERLTVCSSILGFSLESSSGLTKPEASKLIDTIQGWIDNSRADDEIREILNAATLAAESAQEEGEK